MLTTTACQRRGIGPSSRAVLLATAAIVLAATLCSAQDAHYWTYGYGPIGQLTEGALVGGVSDLSAVYYNPAALALIEEPRFVLGLSSIELASIDLPGAAGSGLDFNSTVFEVVPSMVAGHLGGNEGQRDHFAYAFLSRHNTDWDLGYTSVQVSPSPDGRASFARLRERLSEYWVGGTWSRRLRPGLSIGVSPFFAFRAQRQRRSLSVESVTASASQAAFVARETEYDHSRLLAKLALAWRPGHWELGLTATTPGLQVYRQGKVEFNASLSGANLQPLLSASTQKGLEASYHSPWSVAGGATWRGHGTAVHTTAEWFTSVAPYDILSPEPAPVAGSDATVPLTFTGSAASVVNYAVGLEQRVSERVTVYGGAARSASPWQPKSETLATWDMVDLTAGFTVRTSRSRVALGIGYGWGHGDVPSTVDPPFQPLSVETTRASFGRWTFSIGASLNGTRSGPP
jgi:hypothetical protein